ncbi:hypothetical protein [Rhodococcus jostii]
MHVVFDENGEPLDPEVSAGAVKNMLDQIEWWGTTLRDARAVRPYAA